MNQIDFLMSYFTTKGEEREGGRYRERENASGVHMSDNPTTCI